MSGKYALPLVQVCKYFHVEIEFITDLAEFGLFPTIIVDGVVGVEVTYLDKLKEIISLYQALGVNKEGIEVILNLRERICALQGEVNLLHNKVKSLEYHLGCDTFIDN